MTGLGLEMCDKDVRGVGGKEEFAVSLHMPSYAWMEERRKSHVFGKYRLILEIREMTETTVRYRKHVIDIGNRCIKLISNTTM